MASMGRVFALNVALLLVSYCSSANGHVPALIWSVNCDSCENLASDGLSALSVQPQDAFSQLVQGLYMQASTVVVIADVCPLATESFSASGAYPALQKAVHNLTAYIPHVDNPVQVLQADAIKVSQHSLLKSVPVDQVSIVRLSAGPDSCGSQQRSETDAFIAKAVEAYSDTGYSTLFVYTSTAAPTSSSRSKRAVTVRADPIKKETIMMSYSEIYVDKTQVQTPKIEVTDETDAGAKIVIDGSGKTYTLEVKRKGGYWWFDKVTSDGKVENFPYGKTYMPNEFSYHCHDAEFVLRDPNAPTTVTKMTISQFQVQSYAKGSDATKHVFGDAYDCVGFMSIGIWSGIFVTLVLALIVTIGLTMIMGIKTMDRFDDPKGKTITVNTTD